MIKDDIVFGIFFVKIFESCYIFIRKMYIAKSNCIIYGDYILVYTKTNFSIKWFPE